MGKDTVFANGKSVATVGTDHVAVNAKGFDELLVPPQMNPMPTLNIGRMPNLKNGSARTFYVGQPIWHVGGYITPTEEYATQPPGSLGAVTGMPYRGTVVCVTGSPNVFVEGNQVVRHFDPTKQDSGNSSGQVLLEADLDRLKKALDDELRRRRAAAAAKKKKARGAPRKAPNKEEKHVETDPELEAKRRRREERLATIDKAKANASTYPPAQRRAVEDLANRFREDMNVAEMANLSSDVYEQPRTAPVGYELSGPLISYPSGLQAQVYHSLLDDEYILVYRGTEGKVNDILADAVQGTGWVGQQYKDALAVAMQANSQHPGNLIIAGHSLGGGEAALGGVATGAPTYTFNAAGVHQSTLDYLRSTYGVTPTSGQNVQAYHLKGEVLTGAQTSPARYLSPVLLNSLGNKIFPGLGAWLAAKAGPMPRALGNQHEIPNTSISADENMFNKHRMKFVLPEVEAQKAQDWSALTKVAGG